MVDEETFTAIALHQGLLDAERERINLKLLGRDNQPFEQEDYYESYFNMDLPNRIVEWKEKGAEYREALVRALSR